MKTSENNIKNVEESKITIEEKGGRPKKTKKETDFNFYAGNIIANFRRDKLEMTRFDLCGNDFLNPDTLKSYELGKSSISLYNFLKIIKHKNVSPEKLYALLDELIGLI